MKTPTILLMSSLVFGDVTTFAQMRLKNDNVGWSQSYENYRNHIKPLAPGARHQCERLLKEILSDLDTKNTCSTDAHCSLIGQDPFGASIPIRTEEASRSKIKMKKFGETCDDGSSHSVRHNDIENIPVCWKNKCMVKTSFKKN